MCLILCILYSIKCYIYIETVSACFLSAWIPHIQAACFKYFLLKLIEKPDNVFKIKLWRTKLKENDPIVREAAFGKGKFGIET